MRSPSVFRRLALGALGLNLAVILWGAYVRATYSGDGCGQHWPSCQGQLVPTDLSTKTLIEYTHRLSAGLSILAALGLYAAARRWHAVGHPARKAAAAVVIFTFTESLVGAGLVLFKYVAHDERAGRIWFMSAHLLNTFALLAAQARTLQATDGVDLRLKGQGLAGTFSAAGMLSLLLLGVTGAIAALGDTLHPASSLAAGLAADLSTTSSVLVHLRVIHPFVAVFAAAVVGASAVAAAQAHGATRDAAYALGIALLLQLGAGLLNLLWLAPVGMQLVHLLLADAVWLAQVWLAGRVLSAPVEDAPESAAALPQASA